MLAIKNNGKPVMVESDNLAEAAKVMGINPEGLEATVKQWNEMASAGKDTQSIVKIRKSSLKLRITLLNRSLVLPQHWALESQCKYADFRERR